MEKSLFVHQTGNGKWQFRPVVFVTITPDNSKLARVFGQVRALNGTMFELCPLMPVPTLLGGPSSADGGSTGGECLDVFTNANTSIFDASGSPVGLDGVANGDLLTAIGFLSPQDAEGDGRLDDLRLDAVVLELGPFGTFQRVAGTIVSSPGHNDIFVFAPTLAPTPYSNGTTAIDVLLQSGTKIFAVGSSTELTSAALQPRATGEVNGVFTDPATAGQPFKSSLVVLDKDTTPTRALLSAVVDTTDPKTGRLTIIGLDKTSHCVLTSMTAPATLYLLVTESPTSTDIKVIAFGDLLSGDVVDVYGHDDPGGSSCIAADTIQDYGPTAAPK
jgi:hypothetical protein